jgi:hypothetical protein
MMAPDHPLPPADPDAVTQAILAEALNVMGAAHRAWARQPLQALLRAPARKLAQLFADFDGAVANRGWCQAMHSLLARFVRQVRLSGAETLPRTGPLLLASNHPAAFDVLILSAVLGRDDLKIIASDIAFIRCLPAVVSHFIPVPEQLARRATCVRAAIRHLRQGGALLIFPRGQVEPDPAVTPGALPDLERWSPSLELFLRKAPQTRLVVSIVSGVLSAGWFQHPLIRLWRQPEQRQKVAEIFQVIQQLLWPGSQQPVPAVSFSPPLAYADLAAAGEAPGFLLAALVRQARLECAAHVNRSTAAPLIQIGLGV